MKPTTTPSFLDPDLPVAERIDDLIDRLTLPEKVNQMLHENNAVERLNVPAYNWWSEACHGVGRNGRATVFPQVIGMAATWNRELVKRVAEVISDEARAKHHAAVSAGRRGQYQGLTFWTPNINIFRDPRWGRGQETYGEDPYLTAELGTATVKGLQGDHSRYLKTAACAKHFAVHSGPEHLRHEFDAQPTPKDLEETYLPAFKRLVEADVEAFMGAYNRVLGEPACGSRRLLVDTLRNLWGFKGHVVSDCWAIADFHQHHQVTKSAAESAALAVRMGCDLNCGCTFNDLVTAVRDGLITEEEINTSLRRLLSTKFRLGLFDPPEMVPWSSTSTSIIDCGEHRALSRKAAAESIVLLKNKDGALPLKRNPNGVLVAGPTAASIGVLLGNYYGVSSRLVTIAEGIVEAVDEGVCVEYRAGCPLSQPIAPGVNYTYPAAEASEVVIAVMGFDPTLEGEEGDTVASPTGGDRPSIELPENQRVFLRELRKHAKKLILVLTGGSAIAVPEEHEFCDAVVQVWYPGCEGGHAVADVLFGEVAPTGKMPVSVPKSTADLPPFEDYNMRGRTYKFAEVEPLYPFGFGLSYANLAYGALKTAGDSLSAGNTLVVAATLSNQSDKPTTETVQCYIQPPAAPDAPKAILVDFKKVSVPANSEVEVSFSLTDQQFEQVGEDGAKGRLPGRYSVVVGSASPGSRAVELGAPEPAVASVDVI